MRCAIVGSGLAALATYATLRHAGVAAEEIAVFGTHADPTTVWRERAASIRQQRMRSESDGHLAAAAFPGLAAREGTLTAIARSLTNRYHPTVQLFLEHAEQVRARSGWEKSFAERRVAHLRAGESGFSVDGEGTFPHVLVATGHPGLVRLPGAVHAYDPHDYEARVAVVGAGMAAATEWRNALAAGSEVVSIRRREPLRRPLNVPRADPLEARPRRVSPPRARTALRAAGGPRAALLPARPRVGRRRPGRGRAATRASR